MQSSHVLQMLQFSLACLLRGFAIYRFFIVFSQSVPSSYIYVDKIEDPAPKVLSLLFHLYYYHSFHFLLFSFHLVFIFLWFFFTHFFLSSFFFTYFFSFFLVYFTKFLILLYFINFIFISIILTVSLWFSMKWKYSVVRKYSV